MRKILLFCFLSVSLFVTGCVPVLVGAGVVTGYMLSNDSAQGNVSGSYRDVWDIALDVLREQEAEIMSADESKGMIKAILADEVDIVLKINSIDFETYRLRVSARKCYIPKPQFAQRIFFKIIKELE